MVVERVSGDVTGGLTRGTKVRTWGTCQVSLIENFYVWSSTERDRLWERIKG